MKKKHLLKALKKYRSNLVLLGLIILVAVFVSRYSSLPEDKFDQPLHRSAGEMAQEKGTVLVNVPIDNAHYIIRDEEMRKMLVNYAGGSHSFELSPGSYRVEFSDVYGYSLKMPIQTFSVKANSTIEVEGNYEANCAVPALGVKIFPEAATYRIYNAGNQMLKEASGSQFFNFPEGRYWIEFLDLPNYNTPKKMAFLMMNNKSTTINASYGKK